LDHAFETLSPSSKDLRIHAQEGNTITLVFCDSKGVILWITWKKKLLHGQLHIMYREQLKQWMTKMYGTTTQYGMPHKQWMYSPRG